MLIADITDCQGENAEMKLDLSFSSLFPGWKVKHVGVSHPIEAAGNIIDALDAARGVPCIIISNIALRGTGEYSNGVPFCYLRLEENIIIGTPHTFSLLKKLGLASHINQTDVFTVCKEFLNDEAEALRIANSQFRSFEYLPFLAKWLLEKKDVPFEQIEIPKLVGNFVWCTDRFTDDSRQKVNCKTTALELSEIINPAVSKLPFVKRLADVLKGEPAITQGSSGYGSQRFLEIVVQRGSAAKTFKLKVGSKV